MGKVGLVGALRRTIMEGVPMAQFSKEFKELSQKDKEELVAEYNKTKCLGADIEVVMKLAL